MLHQHNGLPPNRLTSGQCDRRCCGRCCSPMTTSALAAVAPKQVGHLYPSCWASKYNERVKATAPLMEAAPR